MVALRRLVCASFFLGVAAEPCCQGACKVAGEEKYYSVAKSLSGTKHCGECCMNPKNYNLYHFFEKNLTKADNDSPCGTTFGYTKYDSTATHGFGPIKMTLDLYDLPDETIVAASEPCCQGACKVAGEEKYYSVAKSLSGTKHCGECCMNPKNYNLYHFFEKNLTKADNDSPCGTTFGYTKYDSTATHGFGPIKMTLDLYDLPDETIVAASEPCCQGACKVAGEEKYYSVAKSLSGTKHCGECCMNPKNYNLYHFFEKNLTKADNDSPCGTTFGYTKYDSTATHGFGPVKMTLDLYDLPDETVVAASEPCCQGACKVAGEEKYYSVAKSLSGTKHCGECCMNPKNYNLYHFFEKNLTKADNDSPCSTTFGYTKYDSTATHGFGPVKMTLDLYDLPEETVEAASEPCCQGACKVAGEEKYYSVAKSLSGTKHCGECCMNPKDYKLYHFFEKNLTKADNDSPCGTTFGYTKYDSTATHGFGPIKMTLDLYDLPEETVVAASEPCCQGACKVAGEEKYYSVAKSLSGTKHCGECCMNPKKLQLVPLLREEPHEGGQRLTLRHNIRLYQVRFDSNAWFWTHQDDLGLV